MGYHVCDPHLFFILFFPMSAFFLGQMDYIYFLYGLAFVFLGIVSFLLNNVKKYEIAWGFLAAFGMFHGLHEWTELLIMIFPGHVWLAAVRIIFLLSGFGALFEFARRSFDPLKKYRQSIWMYLPIVVILFIGWRFNGGGFSIGAGPGSAWELSVRYSLGAIGALLAGISLWRASAHKDIEKKLFRIVAIAFWFYALSQFGAGQALFFSNIGFPLPLMRGILAVIIFMCILFQYEITFFKEGHGLEMKMNSSILKKRVFFFLLFLMGTIFIGGIVINSLANQSKIEMRNETRNTISVVSENLQGYMNNAQNMTQTLANFPAILNILEQEGENGDAVNFILDECQQTLGDSVCYVMNTKGVVIGSSNRDAQDSFLGKNYAFRPYFLQAMKGESGALFALGVTSNRPGYYASNPLKNERKEIIGAVVVKINLENVEQIMHVYQNMFLVSSDGIILLSGNPEFKGKSIVPLNATLKESLIKSQQFGPNTFEPILTSWPQDGSIVEIGHYAFLVSSKRINGSGWNIVFLHPINQIQHYRFFGIILTLLFYFGLIVFVLIIQMIKRNTVFSYFASVVYSSQDAIIGKDLSGKILTWNEGAEKMYGYTSDEMIGKTIDLLLPAAQQEKNKVFLSIVREGESVGDFEMLHLKKNKELFDVSVSVSPIKDSSNVRMGVSVIARDVSRARKLEKMQSEFVSIASHQLRTPLTGIKWFSELLLNGSVGKLQNEQKNYMQQIAESTERMISLVNDLLEVSHIDAKGSYKIILKREDFSKSLQTVVDQQSFLAQKKEITISTDPMCLKKFMITMDHVKIEQVLQNIISNAIKFSPKKGTIFVSCEKRPDQLICSITDHGLGIPAHQQSQVFEKFFRADNSVDAGSGTGLGLYIAKNIVELHKGKIWFESEENKGSTFHFSLPLK